MPRALFWISIGSAPTGSAIIADTKASQLLRTYKCYLQGNESSCSLRRGASLRVSFGLFERWPHKILLLTIQYDTEILYYGALQMLAYLVLQLEYSIPRQATTEDVSVTSEGVLTEAVEEAQDLQEEADEATKTADSGI